MIGQFGWIKDGPHKHELTKSYPKLELRRALLIYLHFYVLHFQYQRVTHQKENENIF